MHESAGRRKAIGERSLARFAFAALMLSNVCLAFGPWLVRLSESEGRVGPIASGFWRVALAAPVLLLLTRVTRQPIPRMAPALWIGLALGGVFFAADLASWHMGIVHTKLANSTLFGNITSFFFAAYGFLVARAWPGRNQSLALVLAAIGVALLLGTSYELSPGNFLGDLLCIAAGLFYTGYLIALGRARAVLEPLPALTIATLASILPLWLLAWASGQQIMPIAWTPLVLLALGSQVVGQGLMVFALGHLAPVVVGLGLLLQPVIAAVIGWFAYGERLGPVDAIGAVMIAVALVLVRRPERTPG